MKADTFARNFINPGQERELDFIRAIIEATIDELQDNDRAQQWADAYLQRPTELAKALGVPWGGSILQYVLLAFASGADVPTSELNQNTPITESNTGNQNS